MVRLYPHKKPISRTAIVRKLSVATFDPVNADVLKSNSYWPEKNTSAESIVREKWCKCVSCIGRLGVVDMDITANEKHIGNNDIGIHLGVKRVLNIDPLWTEGVLIERRKPELQKVHEGNET